MRTIFSAHCGLLPGNGHYRDGYGYCPDPSAAEREGGVLRHRRAQVPAIEVTRFEDH